MPLYEFSCKACERRFESIRKLSEMNEPAPCPECGTSSERVLSAFAVGSGGGGAGGGFQNSAPPCASGGG